MFCTMCPSLRLRDVWECGACREHSCYHITLIQHAKTCPRPWAASKESVI